MNNRYQLKELVSTDFFHTLQEASQTVIDKKADKLQNEYDDFANTIFLLALIVMIVFKT